MTPVAHHLTPPLVTANDILELLADGRRPRIEFQPVIDLDQAAIVGYEALARFGGTETTSPPDQWFGAAHAAGLGAQVEAAALAAALQARKALPAGTWMSVNLDPRSIGHPAVARLLTRVRTRQTLMIEITEHAPILADDRDVIAALAVMREQGFVIAMDDVGAGFAGLSQLLLVKPDVLKIDRSLTSAICTDGASCSAVTLLAEFASSIGARTIAEGVETSAQLQVLRSLGVRLVQGYLLGAPSPAAATSLAEPLRRMLLAPLAGCRTSPTTERVSA